MTKTPAVGIAQTLARSLLRNLPLLLAAGLLYVVYSPVYQYSYLYHDDWQHRLGEPFRCDRFPMVDLFWRLGRPLGHEILCMSFSLFQGVDNARYVRLLLVTAIVCLFVGLYGFLRREGILPTIATFIAFGICVLPGCLVIGFWLGASFIIFGLLSATLAALFCQYATVGTAGPRQYGAVVIAISLLIASCLIYQIAAMFFWTLLAFSVPCSLRSGLRPTIRKIAFFLVAGLPALAAYYAWYRASGYLAALAALDNRGRLAIDPTGTLLWFFQSALPRALRLWSVETAGLVVPLLTGLTFLATLVYFVTTWLGKSHSARSRSILAADYIVVLTGLGLACFAPMLVSTFRYEAYRTLLPLSAFIFGMIVIHGWLAIPPRILNTTTAGVVVMFLTVIVAVFAHGILLSNMVLLAHAEYAIYRNAISQAAPMNFVGRLSPSETVQTGNPVKPLHIIVPLSRNYQTDEINTLSSNFSGDIPPIVTAISQEYGAPHPDFSTSAPGERFLAGNQIIVDLTPLAISGLARFAAPAAPPSPRLLSSVGKPFTLSVDKTTGTHGVRRAFDTSVQPDDFWEVEISSPVTVDIAFDSPTLIDCYGFESGEGSDRMPKSWSFLASNDGKTWVKLDDRTLQRPWSQFQRQLYRFDNRTSFLKYRLVFKQAFDPQILRIYEILL